MKTETMWLIAIFLTLVALNLNVGIQQMAPATPRWEYKTVNKFDLPREKDQKLASAPESLQIEWGFRAEAAKLGADGWELCAIRESGGDPLFIFKRRAK
jgi:hypothetical protein